MFNINTMLGLFAQNAYGFGFSGFNKEPNKRALAGPDSRDHPLIYIIKWSNVRILMSDLLAWCVRRSCMQIICFMNMRSLTETDIWICLRSRRSSYYRISITNSTYAIIIQWPVVPAHHSISQQHFKMSYLFWK